MFGRDQGQIAQFNAAVIAGAVFSVIARAVLLGRMVDWLGEVRLARVGQTVLGLGLLLMPFTGRVRGATTVNLPGGAWTGRLDLRIVVCLVAALIVAGIWGLTRTQDDNYQSPSIRDNVKRVK